MMTPKKKTAMNWELLIKVLIPCLSFFGGMVFNAVIFANSIATKPYVERQMDDMRKYTEQKTAETLKDAFEHSDNNRQTMMLRLTGDTAEIKADVKSIAAKQDLMLSMFNLRKH